LSSGRGHNPDPQDELPLWLWRLVIVGFFAVLAAIGIVLVLALAGTFDPKPVGDPVLDRAPGTVVSLSVGDTVNDPAGVTLHSPGTVEATVRVSEGPATTFNGIELTGPEGRIVVLVDANGYMIASTDREANLRSLAERATRWPHIRPAGETNVLRIDLAAEGTTLRINEEVALTGGPSSPGEAWTLNVVGVSLEGAARIQLERVRTWEMPLP